MKSILFTKEMLLAILNGKKTQTRRLIKSIDIPRSGFIDYNSGQYTVITPKNHITLQLLPDMESEYLDYHAPLKYLPNEIIYVKEPAYISPKHFDNYLGNFPDGVVIGWSYSMDLESIEIAKDYGIKETKALFLPEKYSRIKLKITDIFIQPIQDISDNECLKEGIEYNDLFKMYQVRIGNEWKRSEYPRNCFKWLWESIYGEDQNNCWESNPWVFVYDFKVVEVKN